MPDLLTDSVLPVLGLCPPGSVLLPWLAQARTAEGRPLGLPTTARVATFAVAKRVARRGRVSGSTAGPVAAVLLEPEQDASQGLLVLLDWARELGPHSSVALRQGDPKAIFGVDVPIAQRCLLAITEHDALPGPLLRDLAQRLQLSPQEVGWIGLRHLQEVLVEHLRRLPRDRWRAPERSVADLLARLAQLGIRPWHPLRDPPPSLWKGGLPSLRRRYEPRRPGTREFPWSFAISEAVCNEALVLQARLEQRRQLQGGT
ncbi:MAG: hypothetical protein RMK29_20485 [Myxococcales bacterium]|nr:hypothetical protein [Myxococcota bacterium]MDW8284089.1 hypothetical protein [Myxococcales bacterium]